MNKKTIIIILISLIIIGAVTYLGIKYINKNQQDSLNNKEIIDKNGEYPNEWEGYVDENGQFISDKVVAASKNATLAKAYIDSMFTSENVELVSESDEAYIFKSTVYDGVIYNFNKKTYYIYFEGERTALIR